MDFGDKLKQYRLKEGLSQEQLAEKIGVSRQAITKWETKRGLPDVENMIILAELFNLTLDELVDEKIHIVLSSEILAEIGSLFKVKLDEKRNKLDVELVNKKGVSRFEAQESVDITLLLPEKFTEHTEVSASVKELLIEDLRLSRLEYDGDAEKVFIRDTEGSLEFTAKTDYEIFISGNCTKLDINQFKAKAIVHLENADNYKLSNNGRKCKLITRKNGEIVELEENETAENIINISGIFSELIVEVER